MVPGAVRSRHTRSLGRSGRAVSRRVEQSDDGGQGHEQAAQRRVSVPAMRPATARRDAASSPDWTRDTT
jgi:hypothetical protein